MPRRWALGACRVWQVGLNPFAAFLPILFQLPIFIALFRAIGKLAAQDEHFKEMLGVVSAWWCACGVCEEPFLWIPSLAGPVESGRRGTLQALSPWPGRAWIGC